MLYMLDTNICIFLMKRKSPIYFKKLEKLRKARCEGRGILRRFEVPFFKLYL